MQKGRKKGLGQPVAAAVGARGTRGAGRRRAAGVEAPPACIVDEGLRCPPSRYDCPRPCPFTGWEGREGGNHCGFRAPSTGKARRAFPLTKASKGDRDEF